jgi:hypothetical protein
MRRRSDNRGEGTELGWISMTDLMMLLFAVGVLLAAAFATRANDSDAKRTAMTHQIGIAQDELERSRDELKDWQIRSKDLEGRLIRYQEQFGDLDESTMISAVEVEVIRNNLRDAKTTVAGLQGEVDRRQREIESLVAELKAESEGRRRIETSLTEVSDALRVYGGLDAFQTTFAALTDAKTAAEERAVKAEQDKADLRAQLEGFRGELADATEANDGLKRDAQAQRRVRQELLGIPGKLTRVIMIVDRSQSMTEGGRWEDAKRTVAGWIEHLPVEASVLVVFGSDVAVIPAHSAPGKDATRYSVDVPIVDDAARTEMVAALNEYSPAGLTSTAKAFRQAMKFRDVDAIILFTDGAPETGPGSVIDATTEVFNLVEEWSRDNPNGRVHAVGIGNYFERRMRDFLLGVAKRGGGAFIGR